MRLPALPAGDASVAAGGNDAAVAATGAATGAASAMTEAATHVDVTRAAIAAVSLDAFFGASRVVREMSFAVEPGQVTAIIGPSGCGKSTLLRCLNRMHETVPGARVEGEVLFGGRDIYAPEVSAIGVRRHIGMVFQRPTPFPTMSIRDNVAAGLKVLPGRARPSKSQTDAIVEDALRRAALWDEVSDRLGASAFALSGGQQQRLCIARALATSPTVLLLDEPTASLDPISTQRVEELVYELRSQVTIIIVTHNMQQAARISDRTAFMLGGELIEYAPTSAMFTTPRDPRTEAYVTGRFG